MVAEKSRVWRLGGQVLEHSAHVGQEAHVEHVVGFVQHEHFYVGEDDVALGEVVEQAAGAGDHDVDAPAQLLYLGVGAYAAVNGDAAQAGALAQALDSVVCLLGQLTRGGKYKGAYLAARAVQQALKNGQHEGCGFACACLGKAHEVAPLQDGRDGLKLNGSRHFVAGCLYALHDLRVEVKRLKIHYYVSPL